MINNLKDLRSVLKLCRSYGVSELNLGDVSLKMGDEPPKETPVVMDEDFEERAYANFPQGLMSPERQQYYAMGGTPEADPFKDEKV